MDACSLLSSTAMSDSGFHREMLDAMIRNCAPQKNTVVDVLSKEKANDNEAVEKQWAALRNRKKPLSFDEFERTVKGLKKAGQNINLKDVSSQKFQTPFASHAFIDAIQQGKQDAEKLKQQLQELRDAAKKEQGYLSKAFNLFSKEKPLNEILDNVASFEKYCRRHRITFDEVENQLKPGAKHNTMLEKVKDFRFLVAAGAGVAVGMAGVSAGAALPLLAAVPGLFFGALPYIAVPFICLNIFRAFSQKSILEEAGTFGRFAGTMTAGFLISLGVTSLMSGMLTPVDVAGMDSMAKTATELAGEAGQSFSPAQYIMHGIVGSAAFASLYRATQKTRDKVSETGGKLSQFFNEKVFDTKAFGVIRKAAINKYTTPVISKAGKGADKAAGMMDKFFNNYMNYLGIPAIFIMLSGTVATGGLAGMAAYGGYYLTVMAGMGAAALGLGAASYAYGCRKKQFKSMFKTVATAFSISSSAATMPVTKESLKEIGVSEKTRNSVVPLGANFNMMGTALYLGTTAACASVMFGAPLGVVATMGVLGTVLATAFGAPGAPSSNLILLDPVLHKLGLQPAQVQKMYSIVMPVDRIFDMAQTSLNVWGDMIVAIGKDKREKKNKAKLAKQKTAQPAKQMKMSL